MVPLDEEDDVAPESGDVGTHHPDVPGGECAVCGDEATETAYFAKSY
jgi:prolyl-tRNA synthetase